MSHYKTRCRRTARCPERTTGGTSTTLCVCPVVGGTTPACCVTAVARSIFFFDLSGAHRDLHSFPTRRSSDLAGVAQIDRAQFHSKRRRHSLDCRELGRDRKSTRLNSSHMSSSYAVCCLKKKTLRAGRGTAAAAPDTRPRARSENDLRPRRAENRTRKAKAV